MNTREKWDGVFSRLGDDTGNEDAWLERWRSLLEVDRQAPILDLGCGAGDDARTLTRWGFRVVAADFSEKALEKTSRRAPKAETKNVDLTRGLPFADSSFGAIVASLSLHYFPWQKTEEILQDVRRCLAPDGHLLARLNSTNDAYYTAAQKEEIGPNFYLVDGHPKRLFDRQSVGALFAHGWHPVSITERTTYPYGSEKMLWEIVARKAARSALRAEAKPERADKLPNAACQETSSPRTISRSSKVGIGMQVRGERFQSLSSCGEVTVFSRSSGIGQSRRSCCVSANIPLKSATSFLKAGISRSARRCTSPAMRS